MDDTGFYKWWAEYVPTEPHLTPKTAAKAAWAARRTAIFGPPYDGTKCCYENQCKNPKMPGYCICEKHYKEIKDLCPLCEEPIVGCPQGEYCSSEKCKYVA